MISFVILNWNSGPYLQRTLASLEQQTSADYEVIAVDNGSTNDSVKVLDGALRRGLLTQLVRLPENRGFAAGMNAGIAHARGDIVVALNADACLAVNFVDVISKVSLSDTDGTIAIPIYHWRFDGDTNELTTDLATVGTSIVRRLSLSLWHPALEFGATPFAPEGSVQIYRADALRAAQRAAGYFFDPEYVIYGEDIDLMLRLHALGYACALNTLTAAWHIGSSSSGGSVKFNAKAPATRERVLRNRMRNLARVPKKMRPENVPWILLEDLYRVVSTRQPLLSARLVWNAHAAYRQLRRKEKPYDQRPLPYAGGLLSRTARIASRDGLPPIPDLNVRALRPSERKRQLEFD